MFYHFQKSKKFLLSTIALCLFSFSAFSQVNSKDIKTKIIGDKKYIIHTVEKGQSLYSLAKKYNLEIKSILEINPIAKDGISIGQEILIPENIITNNLSIDADTAGYLLHKVIKGETLYGLLKKYSVTESDLKLLNPSIKNGIKEGQVLRIKSRNSEFKFDRNKFKSDSLSDTSFVWYTVLEKDSLVQIARKFKTTESKIQRLNKWSSREYIKYRLLKPGQKIKLFPNNFNEETSKLMSQFEYRIGNSIRINDSTVSNLRPKKKLYKIGIFLPLKTSESEYTSLQNMIETKKNFPSTSSLITDFYLGYKTALDSLASSEYQVKTYIFDANENDSLKVLETVKSENFTSLDLVYGPWFSDVFPIVAEAAKEIGIPCVAPTLQQNKILFKNNTTFKMLPSKNYLLECMAEYIADNYYKKTEINVVNSEKPKDQNAITYFKEYYSDYLNLKYGVDDTLKEAKGATTSKGGSVNVLLTDNVPFITSYFTQLGRSINANNSSKNFALFGFYNWMNLDNLDQGYYSRFNFHCVNPHFVNKKDERTKKLWEAYRNSMFSDPDDIYFQSYDLSFYFLGMMKKHGPDFYTLLPDFPYEGCSMNFNYFSPDFETGFENRAAKIIEVKENKLGITNKEKNVRKKPGTK